MNALRVISLIVCLVGLFSFSVMAVYYKFQAYELQRQLAGFQEQARRARKSVPGEACQ